MSIGRGMICSGVVFLVRFVGGCTGIALDQEFSTVEVRDTAGELVSDATVTFRVVDPNSFYEQTNVLMAMPTDTSGRTLIPVRTQVGFLHGVILQIQIESDGVNEELEVQNVAGESVSGQEYSVAVMDIRSQPPKSPSISVISTGETPLYGVSTYIRVFSICDLSTFEVVYSAGTRTFGGAYAGLISISDLPEGLIDGSTGHQCPLRGEGLEQVSGADYAAYVIPPFSNERLAVTRLCGESVDSLALCGE